MDNYFILLGLSFDPIETDEEKIKAAINEKRQQWQADAKNPRKQGKAKQMLASIPEIENVMLNPVLRKQEAGKAVVVKQKHIKDMKNEVLLLSIKGHITEDEVAALIDKYSKLSLSEKDVYSAITVPIGDSSETFELTELHSISEEEASQLETYFKNLNEDDMSIFTHYNIPEDAPPEYVISVANGVLTEILQKGSKELRDELEQKIAGIIINIFSDNPEKYFDYLRGFRFAGLNELIDTTIKSSKTLTLRPFTMLMDIAKKEYPYADKLFIADYIVSHCSIKNHEITQDVLEEVYNIANSPQEEEHTIPYEVMEELERQNSVPQPEQQPPQPQPLQPQPQPLQPQPQPPQPEQQPLQPQPQPQPQPEPGSTADILNKVITPFNSLIVSYRNKTSQLSQLLTQYQTKRMEAGSGLSKGYVYFCFSLFAINIIVAIILLLIHKNGMFNMVRLVLAAVNIGSGIFGAFTIYPPFVHWNQMESCVKAAKLAETEIAKIHDEFIHLNFSLLIEDNSKIIQQMESIQARAEKEFNTSKSNYAKYTTLSKKYVQKDYFTKILLTSIGAIVASILFIFLAH